MFHVLRKGQTLRLRSFVGSRGGCIEYECMSDDMSIIRDGAGVMVLSMSVKVMICR